MSLPYEFFFSRGIQRPIRYKIDPPSIRAEEGVPIAPVTGKVGDIWLRPFAIDFLRIADLHGDSALREVYRIAVWHECRCDLFKWTRYDTRRKKCWPRAGVDEIIGALPIG